MSATVSYKPIETKDALAQIDYTASPTTLCRVYLHLDLDRDEPVLSWGTEHAACRGSVGVDVRCGRALRWTLEYVPTAEAANELAQSVLRKCERIVTGYSSEWDGNDRVGRYTAGAREAQWAIDELIESAWYCYTDEDKLIYQDAGEWLTEDPGEGATVEQLLAEALEEGIVLSANKLEAAVARYAADRALWSCTVDGATVKIAADSAREAAEEYVESGDWGECERTHWITVECRRGDECESVKVAVSPELPACEAGHEHEWSDYRGPFGSGGGVRYVERCRNCGLLRETDTWATDTRDGTQGLLAIRFLSTEDD